jgi:hypothetical protein
VRAGICAHDTLVVVITRIFNVTLRDTLLYSLRMLLLAHSSTRRRRTKRMGRFARVLWAEPNGFQHNFRKVADV